MSTILEADETGALRLPASMLPHPGPHRRYRVAAEGGQVVVDEAEPVLPQCAVEPHLGEGCFLGIPEPVSPQDAVESHRAWLERLRQVRERNATGKQGVPLQQIFDEIREDRC